MPKRLSALALVFGLLSALAVMPAMAQDSTDESTTTTVPIVSGPPSVDIKDIDAESRYPRVTMTVDIRNMPDLQLSDIVVTEDGTPVSGIEVETLETSLQRIGIVLAIDTSGSMQGEPIEAAKAAALSFIEQKRPQDFIALLTFSDTVEVLSGFTADRATLAARIGEIEADGETAFYDAFVRAAELFEPYDNDNRNLIVLTDGADSIYDTDEEVAAAKQAATDAIEDVGLRVFGVALEGADFDPVDLQQFVASSNGGLMLRTPDPAQLDSLYGDIRRELNNQLVIRFTASQDLTTDVNFEISAQGVTATRTAAVPGFVIPTRATTTTTTPITFGIEGATRVIEGSTGLASSTLRLAATLAVAVALALFIVILVRLDPDADDDLVGSRLQAYGRRGVRTQEEATGIMARIPLLRRFSDRAEAAVRSRGLFAALNSALEQGNIPLRPGEAIAAGVGLSIVAAVLFGLFTTNAVMGVVAFLVALLVLAAAVNFAGTREKSRFEDQLPDTLTLISTSLRAGYSLLQAVEAVASEAPEPTSREFGRAIAESRLGRPVVQSLEGIADRMRSPDFEWAVMAIEIQREVGGNLAEVLQIVAETMLQRNRLRREVKALTAEGRISAIVLGTMPIGLFGFLFTTNRDYLQPLLDSTAGLVGLGVGVGLMIMGALWLRNITEIEV
jgi:tight adherence protein B